MSGAQPERGSWRATAALAVLLALVLLVACRALVLGRAVGKWDVAAGYAHELVLLADHARSSELLLWNPLANGGAPEYLRDTGNLSPLNVALAFLVGGELMGFWKYWLAQWWLGGVGMLVLARALGAPAWGALVAALGFLASGFHTGHAEHTSYVVSASFLPWTVWRLDVALRTGSWRARAESGALWGAGALSGYPAFGILTGGFLALWSAARALALAAPQDGPAEPRPLRARAAAALLTLATVVLVGLPVLAPTHLGMLFEGAGYTDRAGAIPRAVALGSNALPPGALATFASPTVAMFHLANPGLWPGTDPIVTSLYCGVLVPVLALTALLARPRSRLRWGLLACALVALAAALGERLPVRGWLYDWVPPTRYFRHPALIRLYVILPLCALAACATGDLARGGRAVHARFLCAALAAGPAALLAFRAVTRGTLEDARPAPLEGEGWLTACALWGAVAGLALLGLLARRHAARALPPLLAAVAVADALQAVRLSARMVFDVSPAAVRGWRELDARHDPDVDLTDRGLHRELALHGGEAYPFLWNGGYGPKTATLHNYGPLVNHWHERRPAEPDRPAPAPWIERDVLKRSALGPARTWFARHAAEVRPTDAAFEAFAARSARLGRPPLVVHARADALAPRPEDPAAPEELARVAELPAVERVAVEIERYAPRRLELALVAPADGWLWVTDRWARGWSATVDGEPADVRCANFLFRAVRVPAGPCRVAFAYRPFGFPWILHASWGTLGLVLAWSLAALVRRTRAPQWLSVT